MSARDIPGREAADHQGRLEGDNGIIERELRRVGIGRTNSLFAGSDEGAERAAVAFTVLGTCRINGVAPFAYTTDVLQKLSGGWPMSRIDELLPDAWAMARQAAQQPNAEKADVAVA